jgi:hypothetical protein
MGKGSSPRPLSVDRKTFNDNFDKIFGNKSAPLQTADNEVNKDGGTSDKVQQRDAGEG